jgi:hypothetical protein
MRSEDPIHLLAIDLGPLKGGFGTSAPFAAEIRGFLDEAANRRVPLVILADAGALELYSTESGRFVAFRATLHGLAEKRRALRELGCARACETNGTAAARHLLARAAGLFGLGPEALDLAALHAAAARSAILRTLSPELGELFRLAAQVGRRVRAETALFSRGAESAAREVESLAAERIVEEELTAWRSRRAEKAPVSPPAVRAPYAEDEPGSLIRLRAGALARDVGT